MTSTRRWLRAAGAPARSLLIGSIKLYRMMLSGWLGGSCRFYPSCSRYAEDAIRSRGAVIGSALALWRILRCNPFGAGGVEYAPPPTRQMYDNVVPNAPTTHASPEGRV